MVKFNIERCYIHLVTSVGQGKGNSFPQEETYPRVCSGVYQCFTIGPQRTLRESDEHQV